MGARLAKAKGAVQMHPGALHRGTGRLGAGHGTNGHGSDPFL